MCMCSCMCGYIGVCIRMHLSLSLFLCSPTPYERPSLSHTHTKKQTTNTDKLCPRTSPPPLTTPQLGLLGTHTHTHNKHTTCPQHRVQLGVLLGTIVPLSLGWGNKKRHLGGRAHKPALERPQPLKGTVFIHTLGVLDTQTGGVLLTQNEPRHTSTELGPGGSYY
jgi:hypothetical protein